MPYSHSSNTINTHHSIVNIVSTHGSTIMSLWHNRLGHPNSVVLHDVLKLCKIPVSNENVFDFCVGFCLGKSHRLPSHPSTTNYNEPFALIYCDLWGPAPVTSSMGYTYYVSFVDAYSRYTWIHFLKQKSETLAIFKQFQTMVEL